MAPATSYSGGGKPGESNMAQNQAQEGGPGGKVICTELCRNGVIEHDVWMADICYFRDNYSAHAMSELAFRPICWSLGIVAKARDWQSSQTMPLAIQ